VRHHRLQQAWVTPLDGLTAIQGQTEFRYQPWGAVQMLRTPSWWCVDGSYLPPGGAPRSNCLEPLHVPAYPMFPQWTFWYAYDQYEMERVWSGPPIIASERASFFFYPVPGLPTAYNHTLFTRRTIGTNGSFFCETWLTGSCVRGPGRSSINCQIFSM
jgi:hypothetical protein